MACFMSSLRGTVLCREDIEKSREADRLRIANADAMDSDEAPPEDDVDSVP